MGHLHVETNSFMKENVSVTFYDLQETLRHCSPSNYNKIGGDMHLSILEALKNLHIKWGRGGGGMKT